MKNTTSRRKQRKEQDILAYNISLALSKFTAIMAGEPDKYKTTSGGINYYPSDCLDNWRYSVIDKNGQIVNSPAHQPKEVAGIICEGRRHWNDKPQRITTPATGQERTQRANLCALSFCLYIRKGKSNHKAKAGKRTSKRQQEQRDKRKAKGQKQGQKDKKKGKKDKKKGKHATSL